MYINGYLRLFKDDLLSRGAYHHPRRNSNSKAAIAETYAPEYTEAETPAIVAYVFYLGMFAQRVSNSPPIGANYFETLACDVTKMGFGGGSRRVHAGLRGCTRLVQRTYASF